MQNGQRVGNTRPGNNRKRDLVDGGGNGGLKAISANSRKQPQGLGRHGKEGVVGSSPTPGFL
jgi:hypothetical protein